MSNAPTHTFYLFGHPMIKLHDTVVTFSFLKVNALLYYLLVNKIATRDEVAGLLWPDKTEISAKKNLRNTIYQVNKVLGDDFIYSPNNKTIEINPNYAIWCDVNAFETSSDGLGYYSDVFLKGFFVKDSEEYDIWVGKMRSHFEQLFIKRSHDKIVLQLEQEQYDTIEHDIQRIIAMDEFDERHYQLLMTFYFNTNRHSKVIETYYQLVDLLERELDVSPNKDTRLIYERTLQIQNKTVQTTKPIKKNVFYGRYDELKQLEENMMRLFDNQHQHIVLEGAPGVGKSALINTALQRVRQDCFKKVVICHRSEERFQLRVIKRLMDSLEEICVSEGITTPLHWNRLVHPIFDHHIMQRKTIDDLEIMIFEIISAIQSKKPLIIIFDDIHFLDYESAMLLNRLALNTSQQKVMFILTLQPSKNIVVDNLLNNLSINHLTTKISVHLFTKEEVYQYVTKQIGETKIATDLIESIYTESEGLPFFVNEYINLVKKQVPINRLTLKMQEFIKEQLSIFNDVQIEVLTVLAYFNYFATSESIRSILDYDLDMIEETVQLGVQSGLLLESENKYQSLIFSHKKYKDYLYSKQTYTKKRMIHKKIALCLEKNVEEMHTIDLLSDIVMHYQCANMPLEALHYWLQKIDWLLIAQHDIFPVYRANQKNDDELMGMQLGEELTCVKLELEQLKSKYANQKDYQMLLTNYLLLQGKYFVRSGNYEKSIELLKQVVVQAELQNQKTYLFEAYQQMIYYYLQIDNPTQLMLYIRKAMQLAVESNNYEQMGMLLRIEGVYYMMIGELNKAEEQLQESIHIYSITESLFEKYKSNIAAAYDYIAEICRIKNETKRAITFHTSALELIEKNTLQASRVIFLLNRGITYLQEKQYDKALVDLSQAKEQNLAIDTLWKSIQIDGYYALCQYYLGNSNELHEFVMKYDDTRRYANPRDKGLVNYLAAFLKQHTSKSSLPLLLQKRLVDKEYYKVAIAHLNPYRDAYLYKMSLDQNEQSL